jgi:hypothetical protein
MSAQGLGRVKTRAPVARVEYLRRIARARTRRDILLENCIFYISLM